MTTRSDDLLGETLGQMLSTTYVGRSFTHHSSVDSTQNLVAAAARRGEPQGLTVSADEQRAGRGRFKRSWVSPPGGSILVSVLLRPPARVVPLTVMVAALAARHAITKAAPELRPEIKWPNDILLNGRKTCGILVETFPDEAAGAFTVMGMGINVNWDTSSVPEIAETSTSVGRESGRFVPRVLVLAPLLDELERLLEGASRGDDIIGAWKAHLVTLGRKVTVAGGDLELEGVAEDVDESGALLVRDEQDTVHVVRAGDVTLHA